MYPSFVLGSVGHLLLCGVDRLKRPSQKKKKYGLLSNYDDSVEMDGAESDEDDTLYEARSLRRSDNRRVSHPSVSLLLDMSSEPDMYN